MRARKDGQIGVEIGGKVHQSPSLLQYANGEGGWGTRIITAQADLKSRYLCDRAINLLLHRNIGRGMFGVIIW